MEKDAVLLGEGIRKRAGKAAAGEALSGVGPAPVCIPKRVAAECSRWADTARGVSTRTVSLLLTSTAATPAHMHERMHVHSLTRALHPPPSRVWPQRAHLPRGDDPDGHLHDRRDELHRARPEDPALLRRR